MRILRHLMLSMFSIGIFALVSLSSPVYAQSSSDIGSQVADQADIPIGCGSSTFLLFPAWYKGIVTVDDGDCVVASPNHPSVGGIENFIWIIALNVVTVLLVAAGYLAVGFIIYGGYKYMISAGSPDGMVSARKTIMNACIGLVLSIAAVAIVNSVTRGIWGIGG